MQFLEIELFEYAVGAYVNRNNTIYCLLLKLDKIFCQFVIFLLLKDSIKESRNFLFKLYDDALKAYFIHGIQLNANRPRIFFGTLFLCEPLQIKKEAEHNKN